MSQSPVAQLAEHSTVNRVVVGSSPTGGADEKTQTCIGRKIMSWFRARNSFERVFEGSLLLKGLSGFLEFLSGLLLFVVAPEKLRQFISLITQRELLEDPRDFFANGLINFSNNFAQSSRVFLISYLWIHAAVKLISVIGILKNKIWAYPFALVSLGTLTLYQVYSLLFVKFSIGMVLLTIFDLFILWMIQTEFAKVKAKRSFQ